MINKLKNLANTEEKKRLLSNFVSLSVLQGANYILPLITLPYLVRVLGVEYFGLLAFATATITYFQILTDYGFNLTATRQISIHRDDKDKIIEIFSSVMIIKFLLMILAALLLFLLVNLFDKFNEYKFVYYLTFGVVVGQVFFPVWFFQGMERMKYITYINIGSRLVFTILIFVFIKDKNDFYIVPILNSLGAIVGGLFSIYLIFKEFSLKFKMQSMVVLKYYLAEAHHVFISNIAISLYTTSTTFILGIFTNNIIVGYFAAADKIIQAFKGLISPVSQAVYPYISSKYSIDFTNGDIFLHKLVRILFLAAFSISIVILYFAEDIVLIILGNEYSNSIVLVRIMSFLPLIIILSNVYAIQGLYALGYQKMVSSFVVKIALIHMLTVIIIGYYFNLIGVTFVVVCTEALITIASFYSYKKVKRNYLNEGNNS